MIDTLHKKIRDLEEENLIKDKIILDLKKQVETKTKIIKINKLMSLFLIGVKSFYGRLIRSILRR